MRSSMRRGPALVYLITGLLGCVCPKLGNAQVWQTLPSDGDVVTVSDQDDLSAEPPLPPYRFDAEVEAEELAPLLDQDISETPPPPQPVPLPAPAATVNESSAPVDSCREHCDGHQTGRGWRQHLHRWKVRMQTSHWGFPEYFNEPPLGASIIAARDLQIAQGVRDQLFLHHCDFYPDNTTRADRLTPYGELRLHELVRKSIIHGLPLKIETVVGQAELDQARRLHVIEYCQANGLDLPAEMILVDLQRRGVSGREATDIYNNQLEQTKNSGVQSTTTGTGTTTARGANTPNTGTPTPTGQP